MSTKTISHCQGKGSLAHNNRTFRPKNVDSSRTPDNITFIKEPIAEAYEKLFGEAVDRYNARQKRSDRKIKNGYYEYQFNHQISQNVVTSPDKRKSFYEDVVQIGTMNDTGIGTADAEIAKKCLIKYMEDFQHRNPNFYVFNAVLHMDEATPHLHIDYIPVGHYKRGVDTQNGIAQALKEMGFGEGKDAIAKWRKSECDILREICIRQGLEISEPKKGRGYSYSCDEYKAEQHKLDSIKKEIEVYRQMIQQAENAEFPHKKMPFGQNIISDKSLDELTKIIKAAAAAENDISVREKELSDREKAVSEKEKNIDALTEDTEKLNREALANQRAAERNEIKYYSLYNEQKNLNRLYANAQNERNILDSKLQNKILECESLNKANERYRQELSCAEREAQKKIDEIKALSETEIDSLKKDRKRLCVYIADAAQAVSVLVHETWENEKFLTNLTAEQKSLVMGVVDFCREIEKEYGFPELSEEIMERGGMSEKIKKEYDAWRGYFNKKEKTITPNYYER